ncbi:MAG: LuxR C-terminal-related transcriptional regulator [Planctomycetota bacterium]
MPTGTDANLDAAAERVSISQAARVVIALNHAAGVEGDGPTKVKALLAELQTILGYKADLEVFLYDTLDREPAPRIARRVWAGPLFERIEPRADEVVQAAVDAGAMMWHQLREQLEGCSPEPCVVIYGEDNDGSGWFDKMREGFLTPMGWDDILCAGWIDREDRLVQFVVLRKPTDPPFTDADRELMKLMVCAVAPLIDREMFRKSTGKPYPGLSPRQSDVLEHILTGMSEKEVARALHRSVETVHNHVRAIYQTHEVNSRGELMAKFIDQRVLEGID